MYYIGVDIGGTTIKAGLVDDKGRLFEQTRIPTVIHDWNQFLANLTALIHSYRAKSPIEAVGLGIPGLRNIHSRSIVTSPNIPCLTAASVEKLVADEVHLPVISENDANAAAYAEFTGGFDVAVKHMAYLTLGTGLGSGFIFNGRLFRGASGYAGEFGHTMIQPSGRPCSCGSNGCLETLVSAPGIRLTALELMKQHPSSVLHSLPEPLTSERIFNAAAAGDSAAIGTFAITGYWLGVACANLINMLNLEMIVLGGGVMAAGDMLMRPLIEAARRHSIAASFADCRIVQSKLSESGIIGAAMLARDREL
jgi:glucokinase